MQSLGQGTQNKGNAPVSCAWLSIPRLERSARTGGMLTVVRRAQEKPSPWAVLLLTPSGGTGLAGPCPSQCRKGTALRVCFQEEEPGGR